MSDKKMTTELMIIYLETTPRMLLPPEVSSSIIARLHEADTMENGLIAWGKNSSIETDHREHLEQKLAQAEARWRKLGEWAIGRGFQNANLVRDLELSKKMDELEQDDKPEEK